METNFGRFLKKTTEYLLYLFVFILPWQTKFIFRPGETNYTEISLLLSLALLLVILFLFLWLRRRDNDCCDEYHPLVYALVAVEVFIFISIFWAPDKLLAFYHYFIFLSGISLFFIIRLGAISQGYKDALFSKSALFGSFFASIFLQALLGIYQFFFQSAFAFKYLGLAAHNPEVLGTAVIETANGRWLRAYGGMDHPNIFGGVLAISLVLAAYLLAKKKILNTSRQKWSSILLFIFYFVSLYALFFTFSRSAWLGLAAGFVVLLIVLIINKDRWILSRFIALVFFSAVLIGIAAAPYQDLLSARMNADTRLEVKSIIEREEYNIQAEGIIKNNFLSGVGIGNYTIVSGNLDENKKPAWDYQPVHNVFLLFFAECGIFSLISLLVFLFFLAKGGRREIFAFALLLPLIIFMLLDHWLISLPFGVLFFFLILGLI